MNKEYRRFTVGDLFDIRPTKAYKMTNDNLYQTRGKTPVVSNSSVNNGIGGYVALEPTETGNIITFSDTTTGADTIFYQEKNFIGYPHVQGMYPLNPERWNRNSLLYFIATLKCAAGNDWNYAVKFNRSIVLKMQVELPIVRLHDHEHKYTIDDIDFEYMQEKVAVLIRENLAELEKALVATGLK